MENKETILVVDDEASMREFLEVFLSKQGYKVSDAKNGRQALKMIQKNNYDLILTDIRLGDITGLEVLKEAKRKSPDTVVIMISAYSTTEIAVEAMNEGAYDFVPKPFDNIELKQTIKRALELKTLDQEKERTSTEVRDNLYFNRIIGKSPGMHAIYKRIEQISSTKTNVLISGESGTGKELIARAIHENSDRKDKPFVVVNCGGIPDTLMESEFFGHVKGSFTGATGDKKGLFEASHQGTIFLDEIGELSTFLQVKLLRAVQETFVKPVGGTKEIKVDTRIISATNKKLEQEVIDGNFREDLFFRLNVIPIKVPPLRDRKGDVEILSKHFAEKYSKKMDKDIVKLSSYAIDFLNKYSFPGNVRELENLIERSVALSSTNIILPESLTISMHKKRRWIEGIKGRRFDLEDVEQGVDLDEILSIIEQSYLNKAMELTRGNKSKAADYLKLSLRSMRYRLEKIEPVD
ncbi:MAG: sigma-54-dependent Fis family transcriptional regulator [Desulfobacula sp.]|jgi:two-component system response regulator PilR (NtrC family)|uniref:sigma-54-dependent transcriptional regulator n=1 Tax=Desulfobacula sp. TaxID=2593537 RepID=UPI001D960175|nr:sigma-54-dependent Fis family transcriptional regulator [Desulfobacula sp.]MBT3485878.1 sigma-54-dependent Fis family transcriptional regulator [Desulfobacula sp.]MBT3805481.1 sigma-54-dependent Fis family transcriptional regulator [Desulfobacula sp.]MBT4026804.1 sigma-54-dependent Fis family transcriptional regulator [Desulfobacula sp.]MBT4199592.1 sigma-54-dependent Fis family transcriptional regulator [Desulfobacula sp.]